MNLEHQLRCELAVAFRWAARLNFHEATANHFSIAISPDSDQFLINPVGLHFSQVTASDLVLVNANDETRNKKVDLTAHVLHGQIHRQVRHAKCILHTHMPYVTALACLQGFEFLMLDQSACRFFNRVAYDRNYTGMALEIGEGERVAGILGPNKSVLFLANHGVIVVGESVAEAFDELYYLERAAQLQVYALSTGRELSIIPDDIASLVRDQWQGYPKGAEYHFSALTNILNHESPEYRN